MTARIRLEFQRSGSNFSFDLEGAWFPRVEASKYKTASEPPQIVELRTVWEFRGCRMVSSDGTPETLFAEFEAFRELFASRSTHPTYARLVATPFTSTKVLWTLGPSADYEQFQLESISGEPDPDVPASSWSTVMYLNITISAVQRNADVNGLVGWEQDVRVSYPGGRVRYESDTLITTLEGTDARDKAAAFGALDITLYPNGTYDDACNGPDGIQYVTEDHDTPQDRVPTVCRVRSVIQTWGDVHVGAAGGGTAPSEVSVSTRTTTTTTETVVVREVSARGPGAAAFVSGWKLDNASVRDVLDRPSDKFYATTWERRDERADATASERMSVVVTGGRPVQRWRPTCGGFDPVLAEGGRLAWTVTVTVTVIGHGLELSPEDLPLPALLEPGEHGLLFDGDAGSEGLPELDPSDPQQTRWVRVAEVVYHGPRRPPADLLSLLRAGFRSPVASYGLASN